MAKARHGTSTRQCGRRAVGVDAPNGSASGEALLGFDDEGKRKFALPKPTLVTALPAPFWSTGSLKSICKAGGRCAVAMQGGCRRTRSGIGFRTGCGIGSSIGSSIRRD